MLFFLRGLTGMDRLAIRSRLFGGLGDAIGTQRRYTRSVPYTTVNTNTSFCILGRTIPKNREPFETGTLEPCLGF